MFAPVGAVFFVHRAQFCGKITAVGSLFTYTPAASPKMYSLCQNQLGFSVDAIGDIDECRCVHIG